MSRRRLDRFEGIIAAGSFGSEQARHDVVVGCWRRSTLSPGAFVDVMWIDPGGCRTLLAPTAAVRDFVTGVYAFDVASVVPVRGGWDGARVAVTAGPLRLELVAGARTWRSWLFASRPRALLRRPGWVEVEDRLARPLVGRLLGGAAGVRAAGVTPGGRREWYGAADWRPVSAGRLLLDGTDVGPMGSLRSTLGVGLSSFPTRPAVVNVITTIERNRRG